MTWKKNYHTKVNEWGSTVLCSRFLWLRRKEPKWKSRRKWKLSLIFCFHRSAVSSSLNLKSLLMLLDLNSCRKKSFDYINYLSRRRVSFDWWLIMLKWFRNNELTHWYLETRRIDRERRRWITTTTYLDVNWTMLEDQWEEEEKRNRFQCRKWLEKQWSDYKREICRRERTKNNETLNLANSESKSSKKSKENFDGTNLFDEIFVFRVSFRRLNKVSLWIDEQRYRRLIWRHSIVFIKIIDVVEFVVSLNLIVRQAAGSISKVIGRFATGNHWKSNRPIFDDFLLLLRFHRTDKVRE